MVTGRKQTQIERQRREREEALKSSEHLDRLAVAELGVSQDDEVGRRLRLANHHFRNSGMVSLKTILPAFLTVKGQPFTLRDHFPFEPFFRTRLPRSITLKTARQVGKSTCLAAQGIMLAASVPYFSILYVTPLYEMVRRFSHNYVNNFLKTSPVRRLFQGTKTVNSVLQREFVNGSAMYFSFAFLDAERTRGVPADGNSLDEIQDIQYDFLGIIHETLSGSPWGVKRYTGTPKSLDNTIEKLWVDSSQAEFVIRCQRGGCNHYNMPALSRDLEGMIGPWHSGISEACPGVVCAKCRKPIDPRRHGRWIHDHKERRWSAAGYHIPQMIMPMHYASADKWLTLINKLSGKGNMPRNVFFNEVCGESYDVGSKLVTQSELIAASILPWPNLVEAAERHLDNYAYRILAVDWGGGGGRLRSSAGKKGAEQRERTSFTTLAVMGMRPDGKIDVIWGHRSLRSHDHVYEARLILAALRRFRCSHWSHDYCGSGSAREVLIAQSGFPIDNIVPIRYGASARKNIMVFNPATDDHPRNWYFVDKARALQLTCDLIKYGLLRFFKWDYVSADDPGLISDFLSLNEEKITSRLGSDAYMITTTPTASDDFAQSVCYGAMTLCYLSNDWPNLSDATHLILPDDILKYATASQQVQWEDID